MRRKDGERAVPSDDPAQAENASTQDLSPKEFYDAFRQTFGNQSKNKEAFAIFNGYWNEARPFGLFLRDFAQESYDYEKPPTEVDPQRRLFTSMTSAPADVERKLYGALQGRLPLIAIWNHSDLMWAGLIPRLELPDDRWVEFLELLVSGASLIVMDCHVLSPGVRIELETIIRRERQDATVIVLPRIHGPDFTLKLFKGMGVILPDAPAPDKSSAELLRFSRVVYEDEIPFEALDTSPLFADLLANAAKLANGDITVLPRPEQIRILNQRALSLAEGLRFHEAYETTVAAVRLSLQMPDRSYLAQTLLNAGIGYIKAGQPEDAKKAFYDSGALFEKLNDRKGEAKALSWLGLAYKHGGEPEHALELLDRSLVMVRDAGDGQELADVLQFLVLLCSEMGHSERAKEYEAELQRLSSKTA